MQEKFKKDQLLYDILTKEYIHNLIYGDFYRTKLFKERFKEYEIAIETNYVITVMYDDFWKICKNRDNQFRYNVKRKLLEDVRKIITDYKTISTTLTGTDKIIIFLECENNSIEEDFATSEKIAKDILKGLKKYMTNSVSIAISNFCNNNIDIMKGYQESFSLLENIFTKGKGKILRPNEEKISINYDYKSLLDKSIHSLLVKIGFKDIDESENIIDNLLAQMTYKDMNSDYIKSSIIRLIVEVISYFNRENKDQQFSIIYIQSIEKIVSANTIDDIEKSLKEFVNIIISNLSTKSEKKIALENTISYINKYYGKEITLDEISLVAGYSKSHFSRMFKKYMGINFSKYLIDVRLENAAKLIKNSDEGIVDISNEVGFNDYSYFSKIFKEHYKMSPKNYRENN
ncbi:AraC family transcriptional regulator [Peptoniphilus sp. MSJ-1]|uniref:AraC family transcriptional regulator n=1 Tax=Peptoniphilus ovalis TaxID=2841503 RepID=A0ABS6FE04_9FIRM|nr:helix-turn-helix domain-containing protein [Peptoniphilus ovalis]MBU5668395.1 AraC family transcriptional regulator [Peptoniphilus ovalis]